MLSGDAYLAGVAYNWNSKDFAKGIFRTGYVQILS